MPWYRMQELLTVSLGQHLTFDHSKSNKMWLTSTFVCLVQLCVQCTHVNVLYVWTYVGVSHKLYVGHCDACISCMYTTVGVDSLTRLPYSPADS